MLEKAKEFIKVGLSLFSATLIFGSLPVLAKTDNTVGETVQKSSEQVRVQQSLQSIENALRVQTQDLGGRQTQKNVEQNVTVNESVEAERGLEMTLPNAVPSKVLEKRSEVSEMVTTLHQSGSDNKTAEGSSSVTKEERKVIQQNFVNGIQTANDEYKASRTQVREARKEALTKATTKDQKKDVLESYQENLEVLRTRMNELKQNLVTDLADSIKLLLGK